MKVASKFKNSNIIAFDYGNVNIGVAVGQFTTCTATPVMVIKAINNAINWQQIANVLQSWDAKAVIVGMPYNMDGSVSEMSLKAKRFGNRIHGRFNIPVFFSDERLTTREAKYWAMNNGYANDNKKNTVDAIAAAIILESWLITNAADKEDTGNKI